MRLPIQVTFHHVPHSETIANAVHAAATRLESCCDRITSCRVVIDQPHRHHKEGNPYQVRIDLRAPGTELVVKREAVEDPGFAMLITLIQDAFESMHQQLEEHLNRRRGFVKTRQSVPHARVARIFPEDGFGFLATHDNREVFFHRNSVLNGGFHRLAIGSEVSFVEEPGEKGPQASTVKPVGRHGHD